MGWRWPAAGLGAQSVAVPALGHFEGGCHYLDYLHYSLASGQITGREHIPTLQHKIGLKIYWTWPCPSEQDSVFPSVSLFHQKASISLLSFSIRRQTDWKPQSEKTNQSDHMGHSLSNSVKLWAMQCMATQDGQVMVETADKMWSTGEGNGKPLQYSCLENPMNSEWEWVKSLSPVWFFVTPWTVAYHSPPSMGFSRQEYWSGLPFPSPEDLPDPGI